MCAPCNDEDDDPNFASAHVGFVNASTQLLTREPLPGALSTFARVLGNYFYCHHYYYYYFHYSYRFDVATTLMEALDLFSVFMQVPLFRWEQPT